MVLIFPNLCLWRRSLRSNLGGIDPDKLYRATLRLFILQASLGNPEAHICSLKFLSVGGKTRYD